MKPELLSCPFCGNTEPGFERIGTPRQSCIVACGQCGARHESSDEGENSGTSWNRRAQPAQTGQVLTDEEIKTLALEAFDCYWDADDETLVNKYGHGVYLWRFLDFARAIEAAVLAKRVPMTREEVKELARKVGYDNATAQERADFINGIRHAEVWRGIGGEKGTTP